MPTVPDARVGVRGNCHGRDGDHGFHELDCDRRRRHVEDGEFIGIVGQMLPRRTDAYDGEEVRCPNRCGGQEERTTERTQAHVCRRHRSSPVDSVVPDTSCK